MQYTEDDLKQLKETILLIVNEVKRVCDEECIQYFIIGGSALGAVRHGGFIPWDDDFDIGMTRDNYNKFIEVAPKKLSSNFFLQYYKTDPATPFYFAKVRMNNTIFVEKYCLSIDINQGVFIDVFPYDNVPLNSYKRKIQLKRTAFFSELYIAKSTTGVFYDGNNSNRVLGKKIIRTILHYLLYPVSKKILFKILDRENQRYNKCETEMVTYIRYPFLSIRKKDVEVCDSILFENVTVSCCQNIISYLCSHFGEHYMQLPSMDKRVNHRPVELQFKKN